MKILKLFVRLLICILVTFICIYLFVFVGGWKLLESGDIVLIEIVVSVVLGVIIFIFYEFSRYCETKIENLQNRIDKLKEKIEEMNKYK